MHLPNEIIDMILEYENPYKTYFYNNIICYIRNRHIYNTLIRQLKQYCLYDINGNVTKFQVDALLESI
jgi:hypothetical protein